jgi:hypothetical protein
MISVTQSEFGIEPPITRKPETRWGVKKIRGYDAEGEPSKRRELPAVLRAGAPAFELDKTLSRFDRLWQKLRAPRKE